MVLIIKLLELLFTVAANDCTSTNLNGIVLFLHFAVVSLQVILSSLLKTLCTLKMLGRRYSSYNCCTSRYDIRCVKSIVGLAIAIRGMWMGSDVLDYRMSNVIVHLVLVFGLQTLFLDVLRCKLIIGLWIDLLGGMRSVALVLGYTCILPLLWYRDVIRIKISLQLMILKLFALFDKFYLLHVGDVQRWHRMVVGLINWIVEIELILCAKAIIWIKYRSIMSKVPIIVISITLALCMANSVIIWLLLIWINLKGVLLHRKRLLLKWIVAARCCICCLLMIRIHAICFNLLIQLHLCPYIALAIQMSIACHDHLALYIVGIGSTAYDNGFLRWLSSFVLLWSSAIRLSRVSVSILLIVKLRYLVAFVSRPPSIWLDRWMVHLLVILWRIPRRVSRIVIDISFRIDLVIFIWWLSFIWGVILVL